MSLITKVQDLATAIGTDIKDLRVKLFGSASGTLASLQTTDKSSIVAAINEARTTGGSGTPPNASESTAGVVELATVTETTTGTDTARATTPAGVKAALDALKDAILGGAGPAFDTLTELKALVDSGDAEDQADITALAGVVGQKANSADVYTKTEIGNPDTDLVAVYTAAKA